MFSIVYVVCGPARRTGVIEGKSILEGPGFLFQECFQQKLDGPWGGGGMRQSSLIAFNILPSPDVLAFLYRTSDNTSFESHVHANSHALEYEHMNLRVQNFTSFKGSGEVTWGHGSWVD